MSYARLSRRPLLFKSFTGLAVSEFDVIAKEIESKYNEHERRKRLSNRKRRERDVGAGRPFKLKVKERKILDAFSVLQTVVYYFTLSGLFLFDLDQSNICRDISMLEPLIKRCVPLPKKLYKRTRRLRTIDEVEEYFPGFKAFIDSSEQEIPKPKNKRKRKSYYSGKKKKHTVKTQYMVNSEGTILHKTGHKRGRIHDYEVFKNKHPITPLQVENILDLGYMGVKNDFPTTVKYVLPFRKKRKKSELSDEEKRHNRKYSKLRVINSRAYGKQN